MYLTKGTCAGDNGGIDVNTFAGCNAGAINLDRKRVEVLPVYRRGG